MLRPPSATDMETKPPIPFKDLTSISKIGERIRTQVNRMTANPIFQIRSQKTPYSREHVEMSTFTEAGALDYLSCNGHNIPPIRFDHVDSLHRCHEMIAIRNFLKSGEYDALCELAEIARSLPGRGCGDHIDALLSKLDETRAEQRKANE